MLDHEMKTVSEGLRGLLHYLPSKHKAYRLPTVLLRRDRDRDRDNRKQARCMACASVSRAGVPVIGIAQNIAGLPKPFIAGILLHELTHLAFNLMGSPESEVEVDATILDLVSEADYRYDDVEFRDRLTGKTRKARNLQRVDDHFSEYCFGWWADACGDDRLVVRK